LCAARRTAIPATGRPLLNARGGPDEGRAGLPLLVPGRDGLRRSPPPCPCQSAHPVLRCRLTPCPLAPPRDEYPGLGHGRKPPPPSPAIVKWKVTQAATSSPHGRSSRRTPHEPARCGPPGPRVYAPRRAEGRGPVPPAGLSRPSAGPVASLAPVPAPASVTRAPWPVVTSPFPQPLGSDTIPIVCRPAVQFNQFYPAGPRPRSQACSARGPPDKSLFVRRLELASRPSHHRGREAVISVRSRLDLDWGSS